MPIDTSIFQNALRPPKSVADYDAENQQFQQNQLALQGTRQAQSDANALRQATQQFGTDPNANRALLTGTGNFGAVQAYDKASVDNQKTRSETTKNIAASGEQDSLAALHALDTNVKNHDFHVQELGAINDPSQVPLWIADGVKKGVFTTDQASDGLTRFSQALQQPGGFQQWKQTALQGGMSATDQLKQQQAALIAQGVQTGENSRADASNQTHLQAANIAAGTSRANNRDTIAAENTRAGVDASGVLDANSERTAQAIASGQLPAPTGMALLNPKNQRMLGRVMEINPQYDSTTVSAKKAAATAFTTGVQGTQLNKFATTGEHLDQLMPLIDALDNGNNQTVNTISNTISKWNGGTAVTNFDAVKAVATKEMMAALVAGGGDAGERKELSDSLKDANSTKQLKGVVAAYRGLMGAKEDNLMEQRRAAGLPDSTLPKYHGGTASPASTVPPDIAAILAKHGAK